LANSTSHLAAKFNGEHENHIFRTVSAFPSGPQMIQWPFAAKAKASCGRFLIVGFLAAHLCPEQSLGASKVCGLIGWSIKINLANMTRPFWVLNF
jgi:hypothetical protein